MTGSDDAGVVLSTRRWVKDFVIGLGLCPFAAVPFRAERILYTVCDEEGLDPIYRAGLQAVHDLVLADPAEQETALVILSRGLIDFDDYLDALGMLEEALSEAGLDGVIQVASFHPAYRFDGVAADDPANFSNRSPYPMFHLIREEGLAAALDACSEPESIPERNVRVLRELGIERIRELLGSN